GTRRHGAPHEALPLTTLRRSATARGSGASAGGPAFHPAGGRADRKLGLKKQRSRDGFAAATASRGRDDLHGHTRPALREHRRPLDPSLRRTHRGRNDWFAHGDRLGPKRFPKFSWSLAEKISSAPSDGCVCLKPEATGESQWERCKT